jgi:hypothetical protein
MLDLLLRDIFKTPFFQKKFVNQLLAQVRNFIYLCITQQNDTTMALLFAAVVIAAFLLPVFFHTKRKPKLSLSNIPVTTESKNNVESSYMIAISDRCYQKSENDQLKNMRRAYRLFQDKVIDKSEYDNILADIKLSI